MPIIVQKFGGTSVGDAQRIHRAARRAISEQLAGRQVVLVVSAMGDTTDRLIELARQVAQRPCKRELDMLLSTGEQVSAALVAMAIQDAGHDAVSMTAGQVGMLTDGCFSAARIRSIDTSRILSQLERGRIAIIAGFQGVDPDFNITTLGRGGSDTTAVALAAALKAELCEIYTDVDGVYTTDPRVVPQARRIERISYDEMLEMASLGAGVMHGRAIELALKHNVELHVRSSFTDAPGTRIMSLAAGMEEPLVRGATLKPNVARVAFSNLPNAPGVAATIFGAFGAREIFVDDIMQGVEAGGAVSLAFTIHPSDLSAARALAETLAAKYAGSGVQLDDTLARVSVVGVGMRSHSGVAATLFQALARERINIENVTTSEIVISALVPAADAQRALQAVHAAFGLDRA